MARKLPRLQRVLDAPALFSIAYGEIASSIYFALGIIAFHALGFTPGVLLVTGALFLLVALSYAEGTAAIRETGGAATFVRIAFNDLWGFVTGWALFLDYLIVIALSALFAPHYIAGAFFTRIHRPWDVVAGCGVIAAIAVVRLIHRTRLHKWALIVALVDLATQLLIVGLGFALLFTPRSLFSAIGLVVVLYVAIAIVGLSAFPAEHGTLLGSNWLRAPLVGVAAEIRGHVPAYVGD